LDVEITPKDQREAALVVGFLEYAQALQRFDALIKISTPEELQAFDEIVKERAELTVFVNLSRQLRRAPSSLDESPLQAGDNFERRGLPWIMALARVELGSILAAYTYVRRPYEAVAGTRYDMAQYAEFLLDGLRMHYWALANDPDLPRIAQRFVANQESLAYIRRMTLAQAFFDAASRIAASDYAPVQVAELTQWRSTLNKVQGTLLSNMDAFIARQERNIEARRLASQCRDACNRLGARTSQ
jgi:hypothetical protein